MAEAQQRCRKRRACKEEFDQLIRVDFVVTFAVDIEDCNITDVTCGNTG